MGNFPVAFHYKIPEKFPRTAAAFSELAKTEYRDQTAHKDGHDDHSVSLQKLMDAFDVFIREKFKKRSAAYFFKNIPKSDEEFTLHLLWEIRHIQTHNSGIIDEKCKDQYEAKIQKNKEFHLLVDLPCELEVDQQIPIEHSTYKQARECVLNYIKRQVSPEDFHIIRCRGSLVIHQVEGIISIGIQGGHLILDIADATNNNFVIDVKTKIVTPPEGTVFDLSNQRIYLPDGNSIPGNFIPD